MMTTTKKRRAPKRGATPAAHCRVTMEHWSQYIDGEFSSAECRRCETHLRECPTCRAQLRDVKRVVRACRDAGKALMTPELKSRARRRAAAVVKVAVLPIAALLASGACRPTQDAPATPPAAAEQPAAAPSSGAPATLNGVVLETMNSGGYTYVKLDTGKQEVWAATAEFSVKTGERLSLTVEMPMEKFHSASLNREFPLIYFAHQVSDAAGGPTAPPLPAMAGSHDPLPAKVEPVAPAPGGLTVADLLEKRASLSGKSVVVRGRVVKVNNAIMGKNWIHVQDGSGDVEKGTHDLAVTTDAEVRVGDIVTVTGLLATNKDFGAGYAYDAIVEQAKVVVK